MLLIELQFIVAGYLNMLPTSIAFRAMNPINIPNKKMVDTTNTMILLTITRLSDT